MNTRSQPSATEGPAHILISRSSRRFNSYWSNAMSMPFLTQAIEQSAAHCDFRIRVGDRLVESQSLDVAAEFSQRIKALRRAPAGIAHEIIEAVFACDDDKMRDAATQPYAHNYGISVRDVRIDQLIRRQVFVNVPHPIGRDPRRAIPVNPALVRESARRS